MQGFPETFKIVVSRTAAWKQFGNSVAVPIVRLIAENMIQAIERDETIENIVEEGRLEYATKSL